MLHLIVGRSFADGLDPAVFLPLTPYLLPSGNLAERPLGA